MEHLGSIVATPFVGFVLWKLCSHIFQSRQNPESNQSLTTRLWFRDINEPQNANVTDLSTMNASDSVSEPNGNQDSSGTVNTTNEAEDAWKLKVWEKLEEIHKDIKQLADKHPTACETVPEFRFSETVAAKDAEPCHAMMFLSPSEAEQLSLSSRNELFNGPLVRDRSEALKLLQSLMEVDQHETPQTS